MSKRTCKERPAVEDLPGHYVQDGWRPDGTPNLVFHRTEWDPIPCGHTERRTDPRCFGCRWRWRPDPHWGTPEPGRYLGNKARQALKDEADRRLAMVLGEENDS